MRMPFLLFLLFFSLFALAQKVTVEGSVIDAETTEPLPGVVVWIPEISKGTYTKRDGSFSIKVPKGGTWTFEFSSLGYKSKSVSWEEEASSELGKNQLLVTLEFDVEMLGTSVITAAPDTVYANKQYHVGDFAFFEKGLLLLVFEKEDRWKRQDESRMTLHKNCRLVLLDEFDREVTAIQLDDDALGFYTDYLDEVFLKCKNRVIQVRVVDGAFELTDWTKGNFEEKIKPVIDTVGSWIFASNYSSDFPSFQYFAYNELDSSVQYLRYIVDKPLMSMFRSEFKYLDNRGKLQAFQYEINTGIEKEIAAGFMSGFSNSMYFEPLYAPLYFKKDTVIIFDYYCDKMYKYVGIEHLVDSVEIAYHQKGRKTGWKRQMVQDELTEQLFAVFQRNGFHYLKRVNTATGEVDFTFRLTHRYAEHIRVKDGWVYYVYRPFESTQKKYLYKEAIRSSPVE